MLGNVRRVAHVAGRALLGLALLALSFGLLAEHDVRFDLLNSVLPVWIVVGLTGYMLAAWQSGWLSWKLMLPAAILVAIGLPPILRELPRQQQIRSGGRLRIVQFNAFKHNEAPTAAADWLLRQHPDIITLEETLGPSSLIIQRLARAYPFQVSCLPELRCSTVILSRVRPLASGGLARGDPENQQALSAAWARFGTRHGSFTIVAVHLVRPWPWGDQASGRRDLLDFLATVGHHRLIVAGDFNLTPWMSALQKQDRAFALVRLTRSLPTWPASRPGAFAPPALLPIDHIYAGKGWTAASLERGPWLGSDHTPVLATLQDTSVGDPL